MINSFQDQIYLGFPWVREVLVMNLNGTPMKKISSPITYPTAIEIEKNKSLIYIVDMNDLYIFNLNLEKISSWKLPAKRGWGFRGIQIEGPNLYLTIQSCNQIFICSQRDGKVISTWGKEKESSNQGEFWGPRGISLENKYIYICDFKNSRIQILSKDNGVFIQEWAKSGKALGQFSLPNCIYYALDEHFYIGDLWSVQLFDKNGSCEQRLEKGTVNMGLNEVRGICIINDQLYIVDSKKRIQIFRR